ncbi:hypothetical protein NQ317_006659 [Molorchus minor]|uniref:EDR1/CTR1/ARMC3-like peptidase-like domain-containing protein n=1 Tax=Molorchus minor TaxID=1323400 RepID=A0ABQ9JXI1_9CUCU|nr:hypothetical protein NQ317_006659 [Molorchus minor]
MSKSSDKKGKSTKLDDQKPDDIREKSYLTKQVDTSIAILDSPENEVVLESLLFLSKYADIHLNNLNYLQQHGMMLKTLNLFNRNICILRLALRLLSTLVTIDDVLFELDQDVYDDKIIQVADMYISHNDAYVREFCVSILAKLAASCRVTCLIFKIDLFNPILNTIKTTTNLNLLESTMELLYVLLNAPAAISVLPDIQSFDIGIIMDHLNHSNNRIVFLAFEIIRKLTNFCLEVFQKMFRQAKLVEKMFEVILDPYQIEYHQKALVIIKNCMNCEETESYFIESLEFLKFCQWVKTCDQDYLLPCVDIFQKLSRIPSIKQTLFDLSVEDSILYFLRSIDKEVLNKTCEAISNMTTHKYCCERMLTPTVLQTLVGILYRQDNLDPGNEVALKTIFDFSRRNVKTLDILCSIEAQDILLKYFKNGTAAISEESFQMTTEDLKKFKNILIFILSNLINSEVLVEFIKNNLVTTLKELPESLKCRVPLIYRVLGLTFSLHLPLKFFETNRLEITDQLDNRFYLITGLWRGHLPFLEILEAQKVSTIYTIYVVDYTYELRKFTESESLFSGSMKSSSMSVFSVSEESSDSINQSPYDINYGQLSYDPYLPKYIYHVTGYITGEVTMREKIAIIAEYVETVLCGPKEEYTLPQKIHTFKLHIESLKQRLGTNMIPIGFLRIGFHCERALLFKAISDKCCIPTSLVKGRSKLYWNEVALFESGGNDDRLKLYVVDLMWNIGRLLEVGSKESNEYCNLPT